MTSHMLDPDTWGEVGNRRAEGNHLPTWPRGRDPVPRPLRVAIFVNEFPALSETFVLNQVTGLLDLGHDVKIFANGPRNEPTVHRDVERYQLRDRVRYRVMPRGRGRRLLNAPGLIVGGGQRRLGPLLRALDVSAFGREALSLNMLYWSATLLDERPFDVIHCHFGTIGQMAAGLRDIGALRGRLVVTFHGVDVSACLDDNPTLYRRLFARLDLALPISERWRRRLTDHGCDPARIRVHRMGIDLDRFPLAPAPRTATTPLRVLTIGRLVPKKGHAYGLRAIAALVDMNIPVRYSVVGDGPLATELAGLARSLKIGHLVDFQGGRPQDEVARLIGEHDVLLAPSVTDANGDQEGIPVTLMEAMASGLPVVSTRHSGIPELVEHEVSGLLAAEGDVEGLAAHLVSVWREPALADRLRSCARAAVEQRHDVRVLNRDLVRHYRDLLDDRVLLAS